MARGAHTPPPEDPPADTDGGAPARLFIVGPMAAGKSAVGRRLAARLCMPFVDSDDEIEQRTGVDIDYIFEREGEAGFRRRESAVLEELTRRSPVVLSTGGGAILAAANREALASRGTVVYLSTGVATQLARTRQSTHRPLLQTADREARLNALAAQRNPLYEALANVTLATDGRSVDAVVAQLLSVLRPLGFVPVAGSRRRGAGSRARAGNTRGHAAPSPRSRDDSRS